MHHHLDDTIAAVASAPGPGGRGIVRLSGPDCRAVLDRVVEWNDPQEVRGGAARVYHATVPIAGDAFCRSLVYYWPGSRSYTGQPLAELHTTSSPPLLEAILVRAFDAGARPARPGEFTLRAFLSGRVDLMQAEAVLGVIDAHDHKQLERALRQLGGNLSLPLARVRSDLLNLLADLEAGLDFVDEDISFVSNEDCRARIRAAREVPARLLQQSGSRMQSSGRKRIVLAGLPNAGKSTLFNALLNRAAAIVSDVSGTTRDTLRGLVDWQGLSVELVDTPGRDDEAAAINQEAQQLAVEQIEGADLILWCRSSQLEGTDVALDAQLQEEFARSGCKTIAAVTKCDLADGGSIEQGHRISALTGVGLDALRQTVFERMCDPGDGNDELVGTTAARCHDSLSRTIAALDRALQAAEDRQGDELIALELRDALEPIGQILGAVYTDDILDRIFSRFCIGK